MGGSNVFLYTQRNVQLSLVENYIIFQLLDRIFYAGSTITDFKNIVRGMGGETNASQVVLSSSSTDTRLITKGPDKNTEGKRCYMVPVQGLSKVDIEILIHLQYL